MVNTMTDELQLVESISVQNFWGIFNRVYNVESGFSLEVFRGSVHLGSILSNDINSNTKRRSESWRLRNSDTILRVNLGSRIIDAATQLHMRDGWIRAYEGKLEIAICNPYLFVIQYRQGSDPVALAKLAIKGAVQKYARYIDHDALNDDALRYEARIALERGSNKNYGLVVVRVQQSIAYMDPKKAEIISIRHQGIVDKTKVNVDAEVTMAKAEHEEEFLGFKETKGRERDVLSQQHKRAQSFLDAASSALEQRMQKEIEDGIPLEIIARKYPQFASSLGFPVQSGMLTGTEQPRLNSGSQGAPLDATTGSYTVVSPNPTTPQPAVGGSQPFYNAHLGAYLVYMPLSDTQRQNWRVSNQVAFMVYTLDAQGPAEQGHVMQGDLFIEIGDQQIQSAGSMIAMLDASQPGSPVSVRVLRGGQPLDLEIHINHP